VQDCSLPVENYRGSLNKNRRLFAEYYASLQEIRRRLKAATDAKDEASVKEVKEKAAYGKMNSRYGRRRKKYLPHM